MRIGLNFTPPHESPEQWAEILEDCGFRAASFPVDYRAPVGLIDAYTKAAREHDIRIAEVGVWDSPHLSDPQRAREAQTRCLEQFRLAEYIHADCCVNVSGAAGDQWFFCYRENYDEALYAKNVEFLQRLCDTVKPQHTVYALRAHAVDATLEPSAIPQIAAGCGPKRLRGAHGYFQLCAGSIWLHPSGRADGRGLLPAGRLHS